MIATLSHLRTNVAAQLSRLSNPIRLVIVFASIVVGTLVLFWIFNELFYYMVAKSYADELSQAYNINKGFTSRLLKNLILELTS